MMAQGRIDWRLGLGAEVEDAGVRFRVWAPKHQRVEVVIEGRNEAAFPLEPEEKGYFSGTVPGMGAGARYRYRFEDGRRYPERAGEPGPDSSHDRSPSARSGDTTAFHGAGVRRIASVF